MHARRPRTGNPVDEDEVRAMFDRIAPTYDRLNTVLSLGADGRWRRAAVKATGVGPGDRVVDVACGSGILAAELAAAVGSTGHVTGVDLSPGMIEVARRTQPVMAQLDFVVANALALPFADDAFDAATIAFGLRNLADYEAGCRELARVVRPGGRVVCLELSLPRPAWWGRLFHGVFRRVSPLVGAAVGQRDAYRYLPTSLEGFPDADHLAGTMRGAGLVNVQYRRLGLGSVALHRGRVA